jgi:hypothetical protein
MHPNLIDDELISILCNAGLTDTCIGIQAGSERVRAQCFNRAITDEMILNKIKLLKKHDIGIHYEIITDNPFEKEDDKQKTLELLLRLPRPLRLNIFSLNFFPETEITKKALLEGLISEEDVEGLSSKGMQQFILKRPRDANDIFWNHIYFLASDSYCSSGSISGLRHLFSGNFILFLSSLKLIKNYPWILIKSVDLLNEFVLIKSRIAKWLKLHRIVFPKRPMLFFKVLIFSSLIPIFINFVGPKRLLNILNFKRKRRDCDDRRLARIIRYVNFVMSLKPWRNLKNICLIRSIILYYFLRSEGLDIKINFGIKKEDGVLKGHGWLTLNGEVYLEDSYVSRDFNLIYSFSS